MKSSNEDNGFSLNKQPYGRSFRGGGSCYRCGKDGHKSRDCPLGGGGGGGGRSGQGGGTCYKCGELGHKSRDCPQDGASGDGKCYRCGDTGHKSRDCPQGGATDRGGNCYKCGERGQKSRDCPQGGGSDGGGKCYKCGESGHKMHQCSRGDASGGRGGVCYSCGKNGHKSRDCPQKAGGGGSGRGKCYKCGQEGHRMDACPTGAASKKLGPNVFIGFQVSNPHVYKELLEVQEELVRFDKDLEDHLIPIAKSHITLLVAQVEDENMEHAIQVVRKGVEKINAELMNKDVNVSFEGIGSFGRKIIFSNLVDSLNDIKMMRDVFVDLFTKENINLPDLRFNAHLTIARVKRGNTTIPPEAYNCYKNHHFGTQQVKSIQLMSMSKEETENGYYYTEAEFMLNNFNEGCEDK